MQRQANAGELGPTTTFIVRNPECLLHVGGLAITGTLGQLFIYYTISNFGPVIFSMVRLYEFEIRATATHIIALGSHSSHSGGAKSTGELVQVMASRQLFSLVISAALFGHDIKLMSLPYAIMVFGAMGYKIRKQVKTRGISLDSVSQSTKSSSAPSPTKKVQ